MGYKQFNRWGLVLVALAAAAPHAMAQKGAPTVDTLKQVLEKKFQKLLPDGMTERNVLFQTVQAGKGDGGSYPFRVTVILRDYGAAYPANRYYGQTCVGHIDEQVFTLEPDQFGGWDVQGPMTPPLSKSICKQNPGAGVSSQPLSGLAGSAAPAGQIAGPPPAAPAASNAGGGGVGSVAQGAYECWANGQARGLMNFTIRGNQYVGSDGKSGNYSFNPATNRITFTGGALDGILPDGFYMVYHLSQGRPAVSFRNSGGSEVSFCEKK